MTELTNKQKRFCEEYLIDLNGTQAAIRAGYSAATANEQASRLLANVKVKNKIDELMEAKSEELIATQDEVLRYLTSVLRGESESTEVVIIGTGNGCSEANLVQKPPTEKERLKAGELLAKRYGLLSDKVKLEAQLPVFFSGEDKLED